MTVLVGTKVCTRVMLALCVVVLAACGRDLALPQQPQRGSISGTLDPVGKAPAVGQPVSLVGPDGTARVLATGLGGAFAFTDLPPGSYYLQVELPGFAPLVRPNLRVQAGADHAVGALALTWIAGVPEDGTVSGRVVVEGGQGDPAGGQVEFLAQHSGARLALAAVGQGGQFTQRVPPGDYTLRVSHPLFLTAQLTDVPVSSAEQKDLSAQPIVVAINPATLRGAVLREVDGQAPVPAFNALVTLVGHGSTDQAAADGSFQMMNVIGGSYQVRATLAGYEDPQPGRPVTLEPGGTTTLPPFLLRLSRGSVTGTVVLSDGQTARDVTVALAGTGYAAVAVPQEGAPSRASFRLDGVPVGTYALSARRASYVRAERAGVAVTADAVTDVGELTLALLQGTVAVDDGLPASGAGWAGRRALTVDLAGLPGAVAYRLSEDPGFVDAPAWLPVSALSVPFTLSDRQGLHTVYAQFRDAAGNESVVLSAQVTLDTLPPTGRLALEGTLAGGQPSAERSATASVTLVLDATGATRYRVGDASLTDCAGGTFLALTGARVAHTLPGLDGVKTVHVCLADEAGHTLGPLADTLVLDTAAPTGCALALTGRRADGTPAPAGLTASATVDAAVVGCSEPPAELVLSTSAVTCSASAALPWVPFAASQPFTVGATDGLHTVRGCARDAAGNVGPLAAAAITLDTAPPAAPRVTLEAGREYFSAADMAARGGVRTLHVTGEATGAATWALSVDGAAYSAPEPFPPGAPVERTVAEDGVHIVSAIFYDALGNGSAVAFDQVRVDTEAPDADLVNVAALAPAQDGFTPSVSVQLRLLGVDPADVSGLVLGVRNGATGCGEDVLTGRTPQPFSEFVPYVLPAGDGPKRVCLKLIDPAGNRSAFLQLPLVLDETPPTAPVITTPDALVSRAFPALFTVQTAGAVTEANFSHYEQVGGAGGTQWAVASLDAATSSFTYYLLINPTLPAGVTSRLKLRAVDRAGNVSEEAVVAVTNDTAAPPAVTLDARWVTNAAGQATVYWRPATHADGSLQAPDTAGYRVLYGSGGSFTGRNASQGPSPVTVGLVTSFTLSGLTNGSGVDVQVVPVDRAGNVGPTPSPTASVTLQPNVLSPDLLASFDLKPASATTLSLQGLATAGDALYVTGVACGMTCGDMGSGTGQTLLQVFDLSRIRSALEGGTPSTDPSGPSPVGSPLVYADAVDQMTINSLGVRMVVDGPRLFMTSGRYVRVFDITNPVAPRLAHAIDLAPTLTNATGLALRGTVLFVSGRFGNTAAGRLVAVDVARLDDATPDPATFPATFIGTFADGLSIPGAVVTSRNAVVALSSGNAARSFHVARALARTGFDNTDAMAGSGNAALSSSGSALVDGNWLLTGEGTRFAAYNLQNSVWASPTPRRVEVTDLVADVGVSGGGQVAVEGGQVFLNDQSSLGVRMLDFTSWPTVGDAGRVRGIFSGGPVATLVWGNYLFQSSVYSRLNVYEVAQPTSLHVVATSTTSGPRGDLQGGFLYTGSGAMNLQDGWPPSFDAARDGAGNPYTSCVLDSARFGDVVVQAGGGALRVVDTWGATDRNGAATPLGTGYDVALASGRQVVAVEAYGNWLVTTESRSGELNPANNGVWLVVYDARDLRDADAAGLSLADVRHEYQVAPSIYRSDLALHRGRALVSVSTGTDATTRMYVVDLRPLFDGDGSTGLTAQSLQGSVGVGTAFGESPAIQMALGRGPYVYLATSAGMEVVRIDEALDDDPATLLPANPPRAVAMSQRPTALAVHGSTAVVTGTGAFLWAYDVSDPLNPKVTSSIPFFRNAAGCSVLGTNYQPMRNDVIIRGSRAYLLGYNQFSLVELE